ncbi:MAG: carbohydrate ABC transporter permease [Spirochaetaceae bacterium]|nr:carbohydrate ABC transporter permease [Spirochaetaceae bacterium]
MAKGKLKRISDYSPKRPRAVFIIVFILFMIYALSLIFPFFYIINNSLKTNYEFLTRVWYLPQKPNVENYRLIFQEYNILSMFGFTLYFAVVGTILSIFTSATMAYLLSKFKFFGSSFLFVVAITFMVIPSLGTTAAAYQLMNNLRLIDNPVLIMVTYCGPFGAYFLLLYGYFKGVAWDYAEAAKIDGAGNFTIFFRIMMPQAVAGLTAVAFMQFIGIYNDYFMPYMYLPSIQTLATGLQSLSINASNTGAYTEMFAAMAIATVPIIILFMFMQKTVINNTIAGGLKG